MVERLLDRVLKCFARWRMHGLVIAGPLVVVIAILPAAESPKTRFPQKPAELFQETQVWTLHFKFAPEQWAAMEPKQAGGGFFGGGPRAGFGAPSRGDAAANPGQPARLGGPGGGIGRGGGGRGGFGGFAPAMLLAPLMMKESDQDADAKLTENEFRAMGEKWFAQWDKEKDDRLNADELRGGLNLALSQRNAGPPGFGARGRGPGMFLQGPEGKRNGLASAMGVEFAYVHADLEFEDRLFKDVAVRYKGNGTFLQSRGSNKRSLKVDLNDFVPGRKVAGVTQLNLHSNVTDASWMNEVLAHRLFRDAKTPAPRTAYARVFVTVPGTFEREYLGLYSLVEDVGKAFVVDNFGTKKGAVFKPVTPRLFADLGDDWSKYIQTYDPKTEVRTSEQRRLIDLCRLVTHADDATFAAKIGEYIELDEFARYMAVTVWLTDLDGILGPGQNLYLYLHPLTGRLHFIPWDQDHSFGQMRGSQEQRENLSIHRPWQGDNRFLERIFKVDAFKAQYLARIDEFNRNLFSPERLNGQVDALAAAIRPAVGEESEEKLARFDRAVAGESIQASRFAGIGAAAPDGAAQRGTPSVRGERQERPDFFPAGFFQPAKPIKAFAAARSRSVTDQAAGKSEGQTIEGFGFGGAGNRRRGPGGPGGFGPGMFLAGPLMAGLDADKNETITRAEFVNGFDKWYEAWRTDKSAALTEDQLRAGIDRDLSIESQR